MMERLFKNTVDELELLLFFKLNAILGNLSSGISIGISV